MTTTLPVLAKQISGALFGGLFEPGASLRRRLAVAGAFSASGARFASGTLVRGVGAVRPAKLLRLWDFERCHNSRAVRESLSELDLDFEVRPSPLGGTRFRGETKNCTPRLEDPNVNGFFEGRVNILNHLHGVYGNGTTRWFTANSAMVLLGSFGMRLMQGNRGGVVRPSRAPEKPLELWGFESSPYCHFVRAALCELELPYVQHNLAKDSPKRAAFIERTGRAQFPYLEDPNTGEKRFESARIVDYLRSTYGA